MAHIKAGDEVVLKAHPQIKWVVSYVEGNKIYCYSITENDRVASIVVDTTLLKPSGSSSSA